MLVSEYRHYAPTLLRIANKAVEELLARELGLANQLVSIVSGHTAGVKIVEINSITHAELMKLLPPI